MRVDMSAPESSWDVVVCGGGLAGLTIARQLRRELPSLRVAVVEKTSRPLPMAAHKVGESSVELGTAYLESLGLREYLEREHIIKFGLRFFPGGGHLPLEQRTEIGPWREPVLRSYQLDRGLLEQDLRAMNEQDGVTLFEGTKVANVVLGKGGQPHRIALQRGDEALEIGARWVVDATGRAAVLKRQLNMSRGTRHAANAGWFRVAGPVTLDELVAVPTEAWQQVPMASHRWRSTNHLMGSGYWAWIIPLSTGNTSIGVVTHDALHGFDKVSSHARVMDFLREHEPALAQRLDGVPPLDFRCLKHYSHNVARSWSTDRWAIVGESGAFTDPLYSPGSDFIAMANTFTVELIRAAEAGHDIDALTRRLNADYRALVSATVGIYRDAAPVYGHARAFAVKYWWDNFIYWSYTCQYFLQGIHRLGDDVANGIRNLGIRFVEVSEYVQALVGAWASLHPEPPRPGFVGLPAEPSLLVDTHVDLQKKLTPAETLALIGRRLVEGEQIVAELVVRALLEYGPEHGPALLRAAGFERWRLPFDRERAGRTSTAISTDLDRNFGPVQRHPQWEQALRFLSERGG
jgi:flavin-dependent dehydrogenase